MMRFKNRSAMAEFTSLSRLDRIDTAARKTGRSDDDFQSDMLEQVSRTFALTIPQLPPTLRRVVANAYLLCRIVDTIEDEPLIESARKQVFCQQFVGVVNGVNNAGRFARELGSALSSRTPPAEHELIRNVPRAVDISRSFSAPERCALQQCVTIMASGMAQFQLSHDKHGLKNLHELDRYCYYVAGVVGEMLTTLFCLYSPRIAQQHDRLMRLAVSFGQGLQMTNILKDIWEDYANGACWLPREIFAADDFELREMARGENSVPFQRGIQRLVGVAHGHLKDALSYTLVIPRREIGIRNFCLWAIGLALLTLRKINRHLDYSEGNQVKISRTSVKGTIVVSQLAVRHDHVLRLLFCAASLGLPLTKTSSIWSPAEGAGTLDRAV
ncbi:MAG TPA: phytoene/squalene synthase family protein [Candidatus Binatia bacterium]